MEPMSFCHVILIHPFDKLNCVYRPSVSFCLILKRNPMKIEMIPNETNEQTKDFPCGPIHDLIWCLHLKAKSKVSSIVEFEIEKKQISRCKWFGCLNICFLTSFLIIIISNSKRFNEHISNITHTFYDVARIQTKYF